MNAKPKKSDPAFVDPDDAPEWTDDQLDRAEFAIGGQVVRPAQGTLTKRAGRPRLASPKQVVSLRLEPAVIEAYKATGAGWQRRMGDVLKGSPIVRDAQGEEPRAKDRVPGREAAPRQAAGSKRVQNK